MDKEIYKHRFEEQLLYNSCLKHALNNYNKLENNEKEELAIIKATD